MRKHIFLLLGLLTGLNFGSNLVASEQVAKPKKTRVTANIDDLDKQVGRYTDGEILNIYRQYFMDKPALLAIALKRAKLPEEL